METVHTAWKCLFFKFLLLVTLKLRSHAGGHISTIFRMYSKINYTKSPALTVGNVSVHTGLL